MQLFQHLDGFEEKEGYWGMDELKWNWRDLFTDRASITTVINDEFGIMSVGSRKHKVVKCLEFKRSAELVSRFFVKTRLLEVTEDMRQLIRELKEVYHQAVVAYYGIFKVIPWY